MKSRILKGLKNYFITTFRGARILTLIVVIVGYFSLIYDSISTKELSTFCYGLFAANAIASNCLFAFGRSPIFMKHFDDKIQSFIYFSGLNFLYATISGLFLSAWIYLVTDAVISEKFTIINKVVHHKFALISLAIGLGINFIFSLKGLDFFLKWVRVTYKFYSNNTMNDE